MIATSGRRGQTDVGVAPTANARVVDLIDFASVLPKAAVFVTNGGWEASWRASPPVSLWWLLPGAPPTSLRSPPESRAVALASTCVSAGRNPVRSRTPYGKRWPTGSRARPADRF